MSLSLPRLFRMAKDDSLAQQVEHNTFNVGVLGSTPTRITFGKSELKTIPDNQALSGISILGTPPCFGQNKAPFTCEIGGVGVFLEKTENLTL